MAVEYVTHDAMALTDFLESMLLDGAIIKSSFIR